MLRSCSLALCLLAGVVGLAAIEPVALAQRDSPAPKKSPPSGSEIAAAARAARLDTGNAGTATMFGKPFKFTPVLPATEQDKPLTEDAGFLGVLENGAIGDETGLPPGRYNLYFANVNGQARCYAEANGQIVKEAIRTTVTPAAKGATARPTFQEKGWCVLTTRCYPRPFPLLAGRLEIVCIRYRTCF